MFASSTTIVSFPNLDWGPWTLDRFVVKDLFGVFSIAWYGLIICIGMLLGCSVALRLATKKEGFTFDSFLDYFIFAIPVGVVGARVMYVLAKWEEYETFLDMIAIWNGGIAIYGGVIAGVLTILLVARVKKHNPLQVFDAMVPGLLLAQAIGRWGNFINGEAFGERASDTLPWGMVVNGVGPVHPTFIYESLITFTGFLLATFVIYRFKKAPGQVFAFYLIWYGVGRAIVEGMRSDSLMLGVFRISQCIGVLSALAGVALLFLLWQKQKMEKGPGAVEPVVVEGKEVPFVKDEAKDAAEEGTLPAEDGAEEKDEKKEEKA